MAREEHTDALSQHLPATSTSLSNEALHHSLPCWLHTVGGAGTDAFTKMLASYQGGAPIRNSAPLALQVPLATRHVEEEEKTMVVMEPSREY